jgi:hypothetical protein
MASFLLRGTTALSSLILVLMATATLYMTGNAFHQIQKRFPQRQYPWHGPIGLIRDDWPNIHQVSMTYDYATENLIFVSAGSCALAGLLGIFRAGFQEWRPRRSVTGLVCSNFPFDLALD